MGEEGYLAKILVQPGSEVRVGKPVAVLVGPEGGFSPAEHLMAVERGFVPTTFGPHILRTETAALVSAAVLMQLGHHGARVEP